MSRIVRVAVIDLTRAAEQKGFKSVAVIDLTRDLDVQVISDTKDIQEMEELTKTATAFFANNGQTLIVAGKLIADKSEIGPFLYQIYESSPFYGVSVVVPKANQAEYLAEVDKYVNGNKSLAVVEINGSVDEVKSALLNSNSDRLVAYANKSDVQSGISGAVDGACFPQDEGSINWGNTVVTYVTDSGYTEAEETDLLQNKINYITKERGLVMTQFGRTTSGSNADITRTKDFLTDRIEAALTMALANNKKIAYTTPGMAIIKASLDEIGVQGVNQGMLDSFIVTTPKISEVPANDKANRVLRGVKFTANLSGAVDTIDLDLIVKLA